jgi:hypothetical protein
MLAQHGHGPTEKIRRGLNDGVISGAILSPRYVAPHKMDEKIAEWMIPTADLLIDPELYAASFRGAPNAKLGSLEEWEYFALPRRSELLTGQGGATTIQDVLRFQADFPVSAYIAPNVHISEADSFDAAIAMSFIAQSKAAVGSAGVPDKPVLATLSIDRVALTDHSHFEELLTMLTGLDVPPDGFYVLVASGSVDSDGRHVRSDLYHSHVIANWMFLNHALSINGFRVVNGCADLFSPLLGLCGAESCATGWNAGQRQHSIVNFIRPPNEFRRTPLVRYVSNALLARIKQDEYDNFREFVPAVRNDLPSDAYYEGEHETTREEEALQCWDALNNLSNSALESDLTNNLAAFLERIEAAKMRWSDLAEHGFTEGIEARMEQLDAMSAGIERFMQLAEMA